MPKKIATWANLITLVRLILSFPFYYFLWHIESKGIFPAILLGSVLILTDLADGYTARARNEITKFGAVFDAVLDKVIVDAALLILILKQYIILWWVIPLFARDIFLGIAGLILLIRSGDAIKTIISGKLTPVLWSLVMAALLLQKTGVAKVSMIIANMFVIISWINYGRIWYRNIKKGSIADV